MYVLIPGTVLCVFMQECIAWMFYVLSYTCPYAYRRILESVLCFPVILSCRRSLFHFISFYISFESVLYLGYCFYTSSSLYARIGFCEFSVLKDPLKLLDFDIRDDALPQSMDREVDW